ncbi:MAG: phosphoribosylamine--glycine ligase [Pseudomonadota bacterium]
MNILVIGSGGREHALCWKLAASKGVENLYVTPGNGGMGRVATCLALDAADHGAVIRFCQDHGIDLVVVGPEAPLVAGLCDDLRAAKITAFGPSGAAARLEGSKAFTKALCDRMAIPTAAYGHFTDADSARAYAIDQSEKSGGAPLVVKADGLAAGKGVTVAQTLDTALAAIDDCFAGSFGEAGAEVVIEECLVGEEVSMFFLCDGSTAVPFGTAQDHKRVGDGETGPNTGGMGAYSPAPLVDNALAERVQKEIVDPTIEGMAAFGAPFQGVLYAGLMITDDGPKLIEYNVRFGDPECQVLMMRLDGDLATLMMAAASGALKAEDVTWSSDVALTVVLASQGYPGAYASGTVIKGLPDTEAGGYIFHAGTRLEDGTLLATGGRVLNVTALGRTVQEAQQAAYSLVDDVDWPEGFCRRDIGWRAIARERSDHDG